MQGNNIFERGHKRKPGKMSHGLLKLMQCGEKCGLFRFIIMTKNSQSVGKIERHVAVSLNMCTFILDMALWVIGGAEPTHRGRRQSKTGLYAVRLTSPTLLLIFNFKPEIYVFLPVIRPLSVPTQPYTKHPVILWDEEISQCIFSQKHVLQLI